MLYLQIWKGSYTYTTLNTFAQIKALQSDCLETYVLSDMPLGPEKLHEQVKENLFKHF